MKPKFEERFSATLQNTSETQQAPSELKHLTIMHNYEMNSISRQLIFNALSHNHLFRDIHPEDFDSLFNYFIFAVANEKQYIFHQDSIGTYFFVINSGLVEVIVDEKVKTVLSKQTCFGEMALLSDSKRKASIRAKTKSSFWIISQRDFVMALKSLFTKRHDSVRKIISQAPCFAGFPDSYKDSISRLAIFHSFENGETIINEGDHGSLLYILVAGCVVLKKNEEEFLRVTTPGDMFGEGSLLTASKRKATCMTSGYANVISIDKSSMEKVFGSDYQIILMKNIAKNAGALFPRQRL